jgi:FMN phosphatase YigB (HAD superfamily)
MIQILLLDLGDTLVHDDQVLPHAREALEALAGFETAAGEPLSLGLVSDYTMPEPPVTPQKIDALFQEYLQVLRRLDLLQFFEPPEQHVTLSTHAGVLKPDRRVFETAIARLGVRARLTDLLFITEDPDHVAACRRLRMHALHFAGPGGGDGDFTDWAEAPLLVARLVAPDSDADLEAALNVYLGATRGLTVTAIRREPGGQTVHAQAQVWHPLADAKLGALSGVHVELPADVEIRLDERGRVRSLRTGRPPAEAVREAAAHVGTLLANRQVHLAPGPLAPGTTHQVEVDAEGRRRLTRKRFSAV